MRSGSIIHRPVLHRSLFFAFLTALWAPQEAAWADFVVSTLDGEPVRGISLSADASQISLATAGGAPHKVGTDQVVEVANVPAPPAVAPVSWPFEVELTDGSRLRGVLEASAQGDFRLRSPVLDQELDLSLDDVRAIRRVAGAKIPGAARLVRIPDKDAAYSLVGQRLEGTVNRLTATGVEMDRGALKPLEITFSKLAAVFVDNPPLARPDALHLIARLSDGSAVLLTKDFRIAGSTLSGTTPSKLKFEVPIERVVTLGFQGGRFVHLSDMTPSKVVREPFFPVPEGPAREVYLDFVAPVRLDASPDGRRITLAKQTYFKGIGVRPRTEMTYELHGRFREFRALCGVDDEVLGPGYGHGSGFGSVVFSVIVDGKTVIEPKTKKGGQKPAAVRVPLKGAKTLTLVVDLVPRSLMPKGQEDSPELDNAVWARPLLVR
jgi:hypothetical protein